MQSGVIARHAEQKNHDTKPPTNNPRRNLFEIIDGQIVDYSKTVHFLLKRAAALQ